MGLAYKTSTLLPLSVSNWIESICEGDLTGKALYGPTSGSLAVTGTPSGIFDIFVAAGAGGEIQTSRDGALFNHLDAGAAYADVFRDVAFSPPDNSCVIVGQWGEIQKISDLSNAAAVQKKTGGSHLYGAAYGNGVLVVVGGGHPPPGIILTSIDYGETWQSQTPAALSNLNKVAFGDDTFVAVGLTIQISNNTTDWTLIDISNLKINPADMIVFGDVVYGDKTFIAGIWYISGSGDQYPAIARSTDNGLTWILVTLPFVPYETAISSLAYGNKTLVAGGAAGYCFVSYDQGLTWRLQPSNLSAIHGMGWGKNMFLACGVDATRARVYRSMKIT